MNKRSIDISQDNGKKRKASDDSHVEAVNEKARNDLSDKFILIFVGPRNRKFTMHKDILCKESTYFRTALNGIFKEALENKITLPDVDNNTFRMFRRWAYSGSLQCKEQEETELYTSKLITIYAFAEAHDIPRLQNHTMDTLIIRKGAPTAICPEWLHEIYDNTGGSSPLRKYIVDYCAHSKYVPTENWLRRVNRDYIPHDFAIDLALALHDIKASFTSNRRAGIVNYDFWQSRHKYHVSLEKPPSFEKRARGDVSAIADKLRNSTIA